MSINLLQVVSRCVLNTTIDTPAIAYILLSYQCCMPKQIDLTSVFVTIQLPYSVSVLLLISGCKSVPAQYTNVGIIWCLHKVFQENKL